MGSSYFPASSSERFFSITGPTGPTGEKGNTGLAGYGPTGNTGPSVIFFGPCGDFLRTTFSDGSTFETTTSYKGFPGPFRFFLGVSSSSISIFSGISGQDSNIFNFRRIQGATSSSDRASFIVSLTGSENEHLYFDYINRSSNFIIGITGQSTINTFVGYSGSTLISIPKTLNGNASSFLSSNVFEKARGLGFSGSTGLSGLPCNYVTGGTIGYIDSNGNNAATGCNFIYIDPDCASANEVDFDMKNKVFFVDMQGKISVVRLGRSSTNYATSITVIISNASNLNYQTVTQKRFDVQGNNGSILWPFGRQPCFCGNTGLNVYHFTNLGGFTWYGSVAYLSNIDGFSNCTSQIASLVGISFGACCVDDGTSGGTCSNETFGDCVNKGSKVFWHSGLTCGSSPCGKTGGCCLSFVSTTTEGSKLCISGITCIDCIAGRIFDKNGITYNATSFTYLGNGVTCTSSNCPTGMEEV